MLDANGEHLKDVRVTVDRPNGARLMNVVAERADYLDGEWWMTGVTVQHYDADGREVASPTPELDELSTRSFPQFEERPSDFIMQNRDWAYNSVADRIRFVRHHPDLSEKMLRKYGRQSVFKGIVGALLMFFAFYGLVIGCMVGSDIGWLPPILAAVLPHAVFLAIGGWLFYRQR